MRKIPTYTNKNIKLQFDLKDECTFSFVQLMRANSPKQRCPALWHQIVNHIISKFKSPSGDFFLKFNFGKSDLFKFIQRKAVHPFYQIYSTSFVTKFFNGGIIPPSLKSVSYQKPHAVSTRTLEPLAQLPNCPIILRTFMCVGCLDATYYYSPRPFLK